MARKTKVRVVGDPALAREVARVIQERFVLENGPTSFNQAVGRDYSHSRAPGVTVYLTVKKLKETSS
jgi:hypothetical protein